MTTQEKMEIMQAYQNGRQIQQRSTITNSTEMSEWQDCEGEPIWAWTLIEYRIRPYDKYTPEWFAEEMAKLAQDDDMEGRHVNMDNLMCELLRHLGYEAGVNIFDATDMWYA